MAKYNTRDIKRRKIKMIILIVAFIGLAFLALWNQPIYRRYQVESDHISEGFRIVHLSDLHGAQYGHNQKRLLAKIKRANPDIIVLTGDMVDDIKPADATYTLIEGLSQYHLYYVGGNHEGWHPDTEGVFKKIQSLGVIQFQNEFMEININGEHVIIGGLNDPAGTRYIRKEGRGRYNEDPIEEAFSQSNLHEMDTDNRFTMVLSHRPEYMNVYRESPIDLVMCGHAHGGQVRLPFLLNGLYAPNQGFFPKYAGGAYHENGVTMIVSRGLSLNLALPRVFNPPEVVVIDVVAKE